MTAPPGENFDRTGSNRIAPHDEPRLHVIVTWAGNGWWACDRCEELFRLVPGVGHVPREEAVRG